ncbi:hypothetical protein [Aurantibacter sp.]|uniref:hypothetical protein n=1 Tax=Aurantibacter sp. TaxID=2807103 RepID=UPI00326539F7
MNKVKKTVGQCALLLLIVTLSSCSVTKSSSDGVYAEAWQKVLKSQAWKDALVSEDSNDSQDQEFYASNDDAIIIDDYAIEKSTSKATFEVEYDELVRTAYVRIIAQAEKADERLEKEYMLRNAVALNKEKKKSKEFKEKLEKINQRFHAHREMLEGLKSWNIFSTYGTDDLEFFKDENQAVVQEMFQQGKGEAAVINFLIYQLADLYHF